MVFNKSVIGYLLLIIVGVFGGQAIARDIYVNHETGNDLWPGTIAQPYKTIDKASKSSVAGDTIHLVRTASPYTETVPFYNKSGAPGNPITLDGHGATMTGSIPITPSQWTEISPGLYRCATLYQQTDHGAHLDDGSVNAVLGRYFLIFDGKMNHMGRTMKGPSEPFKDPSSLQEGEWTFVKAEIAFYIKIDPSKTLAEYNIEAPLRSSGVAIYGDLNEHIVIRNLELRHVYGDGFNLHGDAHDIFLQNVRAIECGDDGISAHETFEVRVDGFTSIGNSTGICDGQDSVTDYNNVWMCGNLGHDVYMYSGSGSHVIRNSIIITDADKPIVIEGGSGVHRLEMENVAVIYGKGNSRTIEVKANASLTARRCTFNGLDFSALGSLDLQNCIIAGNPQPEISVSNGSQWTGATNAYGLSELQIGSGSYTADNFDDYLLAYEPAGDSIWLEELYFDNALKMHPTGAVTNPNMGADLPSTPFTGSTCFCPNVRIDLDYFLMFTDDWLDSGFWP